MSQFEDELEAEPTVEDMLVEVIFVEVMLAEVVLIVDGILAVDSRFVDSGSRPRITLGTPSTLIAKETKRGKLNFVLQLKRDLKIGPSNPWPHPVRTGSVGSPPRLLMMRP